MSSIYVVDPLWTGVKHVGFDSAFLVVLKGCFPGDTIHFFAESSHLNDVRKIIGEENNDIILNSIYLPFQNKKFKIPLLYGVSLIQSVFAMVRYSKKGLLVFSGMNPFVLLALHLLNIFLGRKFLVVAHGELSFLNKRVSDRLNLHYRMEAAAFRAAWRRSVASRGIYFIVLGEFIYRSLLAYVTENSKTDKIIVMEHPYVFRDLALIDQERTSRKLNLAIVGLATRSKNADKIVGLWTLLKAKSLTGLVNLSIIGKVSDFKQDLTDTDIKHYSHGAFIEQDAYDRLIDEQDYILFFYPNDSYMLTASGAFLDCLLHRKPIIAIRNDFFGYYMDKVGEFGYLADDVKGMAEFILELVLNHNKSEMIERRIEQQHAINRLRSYFSPEQVARSLSMELKKIANFPEI